MCAVHEIIFRFFFIWGSYSRPLNFNLTFILYRKCLCTNLHGNRCFTVVLYAMSCKKLVIVEFVFFFIVSHPMFGHHRGNYSNQDSKPRMSFELYQCETQVVTTVNFGSNNLEGNVIAKRIHRLNLAHFLQRFTHFEQ